MCAYILKGSINTCEYLIIYLKKNVQVNRNNKCCLHTQSLLFALYKQCYNCSSCNSTDKETSLWSALYLIECWLLFRICNSLSECVCMFSKAKWFLMFTCLQVYREDNTQCHQHGLLQLPRFCWEQRWFPENGGRQNAAVWGWGLQHKAGNRWVCGQCAVVEKKMCDTCPLKLVSTGALILSWAKKGPLHNSS